MKKITKIALSQKVPIGILELILKDEELSILKLLCSSDEQALQHWQNIWETTGDYESLSFSTKELMPSAVHKIKQLYPSGQWKKFIPDETSFLEGLPRYTWTKNQYILNQFRRIVTNLENSNIEVVALKGVCEILANSHLSLMRTSRDIDILIKPENWEECKTIFQNSGWTLSKNEPEFEFSNKPIYPHAKSFTNKDNIITLDVHFTAISGHPKYYSEEFTKHLWERKIKLKSNPDFFIPALEDRFIISTTNGYSLQNWTTEIAFKYLYDAALISNNMTQEQLKNTIIHGEKCFGLGSIIEQFYSVLYLLKENNEDFNNARSKRENYYFFSPKLETNVTFVSNFIYLRYFIELGKLFVSGDKTIHTLYFSSTRLGNFIFYRIPRFLFNKLFPPKSNRRIIKKRRNNIIWYLMK